MKKNINSDKKKKSKVEVEVIEIAKKELENLQDELANAKQREERSLADYQNLVRRTNNERSKVARLATAGFISELIQPLSHLSLASKQLDDVGLNMVVDQFWQVLESNGLKKIECLGKEFELDTMEAVEKGEKGKKVVKIAKDGYLLNGEVIQHAKVILD